MPKHYCYWLSDMDVFACLRKQFEQDSFLPFFSSHLHKCLSDLSVCMLVDIICTNIYFLGRCYFCVFWGGGGGRLLIIQYIIYNILRYYSPHCKSCLKNQDTAVMEGGLLISFVLFIFDLPTTLRKCASLNVAHIY